MKQLLFFTLLLFLNSTLYSQEPLIPEPTLKMVSDFENILSDTEEQQLAYDLKKEYDANSNQLMIITIPTSYLGNLVIEDYAQKLFEKWQPGQKGLDNGVLLIVCGSKIDSIGRKLRIHTGYGLEGALPDLLCSKIEREVIVPELKKGNYFTAIRNGALSILNFAGTENKGKTPQYKIDVTKSKNHVYDYARIFTEEEKENLEVVLKQNYNISHFFIFTNTDYNLDYNTVGFNTKWSSDSAIIQLAYNPGYYMGTDSVLRFDKAKAASSLQYYVIDNEFNYTVTAEATVHRERLTKLVEKGSLYPVVLEMAQTAENAYGKKLNNWLVLLGLFIGLTVFAFVVYNIVKKKDPYKNKQGILKILLGIVLVLISFYSFIALLSIEILFYLPLRNTLQIPYWLTLVLCILLAISQIVNLVFVSMINEIYFNSKLFSWLGKGGSSGSYGNSRDKNNDSGSSNSSYNSSGSNSNSTSNSGYYGGGGKSGGGGASSDW